jgi:hypothetical protein
MARKLRLKRGNTAANNAYTGAAGEVTVDTTKNTVVVHDGATAGGFPLAVEGATGSGIVETITGVDGVLVDDTDPANIIISSSAVLKNTTPLISYCTNSFGNEVVGFRSGVLYSQAISPSKGVVAIDCENSYDKTIKVFLDANVTSWTFNNRPPASYYFVLDVYIIQDSSPKTCVSPATAGKSAGGAWSVSGIANSVQRLTLKVTNTEVELYPFAILS